MPADLPKIYWDSCVFLSYINKMPDRMPHIDWHLERSGREFQLVTSVLTVAEVAFAEIEKQGRTLSTEVAERIDALWLSDDSPVKLAEVHLDLTLYALHLATAKRLGVAEIHTYSTDWPRNAELLGIKIHPPIATTPTLPMDL